MTEIQKRIYLAEGDAPNGYLSAPIGFLPSDWEYAKLRDLSLELTETAGHKKYETVSISAGIGFVNQAEKFGKELSGKQYEKYIVLHKGDFSYNKGNSNRYPQGCIYRLNDREEAAVPNVFESFRIVKGCPEYYEQLFISGFLNHQLFRLINHGVRDDGLLNLTGTDFYSCLLPVPPVKEQERIVDVLSTCDSMISRYEEKAEQYRTLKKYLLDKIFPREGAAVPEIRFPGFNDAWEQRKLGEVAFSFEYGLNAAAKEFDGVNKYLRITDIDDSSRVFRDDDLTSPDTDLSAASSYQLHDGDILFARTGASVGKSFIYRESDGLVYFAGFLIRAKIKPEYDSEFVFQNTLGAPYEKYIRITSQRSGQPGVNAQEYAEYTFLVPGFAEQKEIGNFLRQLDNLITLHQQEAEAWKTKKKTLAQLLLTGIVRTTV